MPRANPHQHRRRPERHPTAMPPSQRFSDGFGTSTNRDRMAITDQEGDTAEQLAGLHEQLARVARKIAKLLTQPRYDEAELAELDVEANRLREQIRQARPVVEPDRY